MALFVRAENRLVVRLLGTSADARVVRALGEAFEALGNADASDERAQVEGAVRGRSSKERARPFFAAAKLASEEDGNTVEVVLFAAAPKAAESIAQSFALDGMVFVAGDDAAADLKRYRSVTAAGTTWKESTAAWRHALVGASSRSDLARELKSIGVRNARCFEREQAFEAVKGLIETVLGEVQEGTRPLQMI